MTLKTTMHNTNRKLFIAFVLVEIILLLITIIFFDTKVLYNTQIAYVTATLVMVASLVSYRRMVNTRVEHNIITMDDSKDVIDTLEDPYDLYSEEVVELEEKELTHTQEEDRKNLKKDRRTLLQTLKDTKAALSVYRLSAYVLLILGFLYLNRHGLLDITSYLLSLGLPFVILVSVLLAEKENHNQD